MKIISWNVNGLRAIAKKGNWKELLDLNADILCLQETKVHTDELDDAIKNPDGYHGYFSHSVAKKGYSGVAIYSKKKPDVVKYGMGIPEFDQEGRMIEVHFGDLVLLNVYFPNGGGGPIRLAYKLDFYDEFLAYVLKLRKQGKSVIFCGDINTAHEEIDLARPKENEENTGFLPEERAWLDEVVNVGFIDSFRHFYPNKKDMYTFWDMKSRARDRNVGWRLDYFFVSSDLLPKLKSASMLSDMLGSDHCPIAIELK
jgi:exodeoxyribonuclease-3